MGRIKGKDTKPELIVRKALHKLGYRFRLHRRDLAGRPDIVLPRLRTVIFVHGCFWHRHAGCRLTTSPKTRAEFWEEKFQANTARDQRNQRALLEDGWNVLIVWECETRDAAALENMLVGAISDIEGRAARTSQSASE